MDYSRYPNKDVQFKWLRFYLEETARINGECNLHITTRKLYPFIVKIEYAMCFTRSIYMNHPKGGEGASNYGRTAFEVEGFPHTDFIVNLYCM